MSASAERLVDREFDEELVVEIVELTPLLKISDEAKAANSSLAGLYCSDLLFAFKRLNLA